MKNIYLIRHGLPDFPGGQRMCLGTTDIPMGAEGLRQAEQMAARLPPVTAVFSSPLQRAVQTAQAIGMPITVLPELRELHAGAWDGMFFQDIRAQFPDLYAARGGNPCLPIPGEEDPEQGVKRFRTAMEEAVHASEGDLAVVAHGGIIARFLVSIGGAWRKPDYTQIIRLIWENSSFRIWEENDHAEYAQNH